MTISNEKIVEYQTLCRSHLGIDINLEEARVEASHLVRILRILKRKSK